MARDELLREALGIFRCCTKKADEEKVQVAVGLHDALLKSGYEAEKPQATSRFE